MVAVILIFSVSATAMIARDPGKLDFVWVSLSTKDKISFSPVEEESSQKNTINGNPDQSNAGNIGNSEFPCGIRKHYSSVRNGC
ncbi:MAG: hypothetical protein MZV70_32230 [Desulfobacterales bacterium]|nr:hypothetical protein [Desulfobacterales bacterium]MCK7508262.1 hypothetical protein [Desulfobacterales bacterium]